MTDLAPYIEAWDEGHRELAIAFEGLPDDDLWRRPHARLLSVGELAGHIAYAQATWITGGGDYRPDLSKLPIQSPLVANEFSYYSHSIEAPAVELGLGPAEVIAEVLRVHDLAKSFVVDKKIADPYPGQWQTWGNLLQYQAFHVAYHTGQAYSARHLLGHETEDN